MDEHRPVRPREGRRLEVSATPIRAFRSIPVAQANLVRFGLAGRRFGIWYSTD